MQKITGVILSAGKGSRFAPLTDTTPKPLLNLAGKTLIERTIEGMLPFVDSVVIVVPPDTKNVFEEILSLRFPTIALTCVPQTEVNGNATALLAAEEVVETDSFFITYADDAYDPAYFKLLSTYDIGMIGMKHPDWRHFGVLEANTDGTLKSIVEKPEQFMSDVVNPGVFKVHKDIFSYAKQVTPSTRGEYELTDAITAYAKDHPFPVVETTTGWIPMSYPWHMFKLLEHEGKSWKTKIEGDVEDGATIKGNVIIGKGTIVRSGAYIDGNIYIGNDCVIGPNCYIRGNVSIGKACKVGNAVEIKNSILGNDVKASHLTYICDSIVGNNVNYGAGTVIANLRHDHEHVNVLVKGQKVDTGLKKFGAIIGDSVKFGVKTIIYPGRTVETGRQTLPGEIVK